MFISPYEMRETVCGKCRIWTNEKRGIVSILYDSSDCKCRSYKLIGKFLRAGACTNPEREQYFPSIRRIANNESCTDKQAEKMIAEARDAKTD